MAGSRIKRASVAAVSLIAAVAVLAPSSASAAATVGVSSDGELGIFGAPEDERDVIELSGTAPTVFLESSTSIDLSSGGCGGTPAGPIKCEGVTSLRVSLGGADDVLADQVEGVPGLISGGTGNDELTTLATAARTIFGGDGADRLAAAGVERGMTIMGGEGGDDQLLVGMGTSQLTGGEGADTIRGGSDGDKVRGTTGDDRINTGDGDDRIFGEDGNDRIDAGEGRDKVVSGEGKDRVNVRDGETDRVNCTDGRDRVRSDRKLDRLTRC